MIPFLCFEVTGQTQRLRRVGWEHRMAAHLGLAEACHALEAPIRHDGHDSCIQPKLSVPGGCLTGVLSKSAQQLASRPCGMQGTWNDWTRDADRSAVLLKLNEQLHVVEQLRDDQVCPSINLH